MSKAITIKLTRTGINVGPFLITDQFGNTIATDVSKSTLSNGISYVVDDSVQMITMESLGGCKSKKTVSVTLLTPEVYEETETVLTSTACVWRHLTNPVIYNTFYGDIQPYVIEYPFSYQYQDEILQNVKDYTKAYKYLPDPDGIFNDAAKIETDNVWFNKAIVYNGQQCSGLLELVPKPLNNLQSYLQYPIFNTKSKTITFTKSDNFYQYNTFWSMVKNKSEPLFVRSCESMSIDKVLNQSNMDYGTRSYKKETLRAKEVRLRHILDNSDVAHLVSQFILAPAQISYK